MKTPKHTPGPWQHELYSVSGGQIFTREGLLIADVIGNPENRFDNARLIASAPDMYKALTRVLDSVFEPDKWSHDVRFALQAADGEERIQTALERKAQKDAARRLELAAPELLEAAYRAIELINKPRNEGIFEARTLLAQAIAKAEGR